MASRQEPSPSPRGREPSTPCIKQSSREDSTPLSSIVQKKLTHQQHCCDSSDQVDGLAPMFVPHLLFITLFYFHSSYHTIPYKFDTAALHKKAGRNSRKSLIYSQGNSHVISYYCVLLSCVCLYDVNSVVCLVPPSFRGRGETQRNGT